MKKLITNLSILLFLIIFIKEIYCLAPNNDSNQIKKIVSIMINDKDEEDKKTMTAKLLEQGAEENSIKFYKQDNVWEYLYKKENDEKIYYFDSKYPTLLKNITNEEIKKVELDENLKKFPVLLRIEIAEICARNDVSNTVINFKKFGLNVKEHLRTIIKIVKICVQKHSYITITKFEKFGLNVKEHLPEIIEIAKFCADVDASNIVQNFEEFGLNVKEHLPEIIEIAKIYAKNNAFYTSKYFKNFGLNANNEKHLTAIIEIAKICAENNASKTIKYFKKFGLNVKEHLPAIIEIAKICAKKNSYDTVENFEKFGLNVKEHLPAIIEIAKICAKDDASKTVENFEKFGLNVKEHLPAIIEIAKICAKNKYSDTAKHFENFGLDANNEKHLPAIIEIVKIYAENYTYATVENFEKFSLDANNEKHLPSIIEIAEICAKNSASDTAKHFKNFGLNVKEHLPAIIEIAKICAVNNASATIKYFENFGLDANNEKHLPLIIEIAKICAKDDASKTIEYFENFGLNAKEHLPAIIEIAKIYAKNNASKTIKYFKNFGLDANNEKHLPAIIKIAKICAENYTCVTVENFKNFGLDAKNEKHLPAIIKIAKICAKNKNSYTTEYFENFGLDANNEKHLPSIIEIAKICAENNAYYLQNFKNFGLDAKNEKHLPTIIEIAKICAENYTYVTVEYFKNFGLDANNEKHLPTIIEIAKICAENNTYVTVENFKKFGLDANNEKHLPAIIEITKICCFYDISILNTILTFISKNISNEIFKDQDIQYIQKYNTLISNEKHAHYKKALEMLLSLILKINLYLCEEEKVYEIFRNNIFNKEDISLEQIMDNLGNLLFKNYNDLIEKKDKLTKKEYESFRTIINTIDFITINFTPYIKDKKIRNIFVINEMKKRLQNLKLSNISKIDEIIINKLKENEKESLELLIYDKKINNNIKEQIIKNLFNKGIYEYLQKIGKDNFIDKICKMKEKFPNYRIDENLIEYDITDLNQAKEDYDKISWDKLSLKQRIEKKLENNNIIISFLTDSGINPDIKYNRLLDFKLYKETLKKIKDIENTKTTTSENNKEIQVYELFKQGLKNNGLKNEEIEKIIENLKYGKSPINKGKEEAYKKEFLIGTGLTKQDLEKQENEISKYSLTILKYLFLLTQGKTDITGAANIEQTYTNEKKNGYYLLKNNEKIKQIKKLENNVFKDFLISFSKPNFTKKMNEQDIENKLKEKDKKDNLSILESDFYIKKIKKYIKETASSKEDMKDKLEQDLEKIIKIIAPDTINEINEINETNKTIIKEITDHIIDSLLTITKVEDIKDIKEYKTGVIEYVEKKDLIKFMRIADGTSACIGTNKGNYNLTVPQSLIDDMTFGFIITDKETKENIGFLIGKYGLNSKKELVVLTHQLYLRSAYGDGQTVLNAMEIVKDFFTEMGIKEIYMTTHSFGGDARLVSNDVEKGWSEKIEKVMGLMTAKIKGIYGDMQVNQYENQWTDEGKWLVCA